MLAEVFLGRPKKAPRAMSPDQLGILLLSCHSWAKISRIK